jgi:hypothetical protein
VRPSRQPPRQPLRGFLRMRFFIMLPGKYPA